MPHRWKTLYDRNRGVRSNALRLDVDGNLVGRLKLRKGLYRFLFEVDRGSFDPDFMFFDVYGVRVGPSTQLPRVPGYSDATEKTRYLKDTWVCPMVDVYQDRNCMGSALTEFPSQKEFAAGFHFGEFALAFEGREHDVRLVNGRGYRLGFRRVLIRKDERPPRVHVELKRSLRGKHPRLYFRGREPLRTRAKNRSASRWQHFRHAVEVRRDELVKGSRADASDVLPFALMHLVTGRRRYFEIALGAMQHLLTEELPGPEAGRMMYRGYQYVEPGGLVEIASCFYDWCYDDIDPAWRDLIRASVARVMAWWMDFIRFNTLEWPGNPGGMGHSAYNYHAVGIAGLAFHGEIPDARRWLDWAVRHFDIAKERTPDEGSVGLFIKEHSFQAYLLFATALHHATGINQPADWRFFRNHPAHRITRETASMEFFPQMEIEYSPNFISWEGLAALTGNPMAQWLAERYMAKALMPQRVGITHGRNSHRIAFMWRFLQHDPRVPSHVDLGRLPLDRLDRDTGLVIMRSGWMKHDDVAASLYSGTEFGRKTQELEHRVSHPDYPAGNSISLHAHGERLVVPGGNNYRPRTADQSTLTVENDGQIEDNTFFGCRKAASQVGRIVAFHSGTKLSYAAGEASQCYEPEVGVRQFTRHMVYLKPNLVAVYDEIELDRPRPAAVHLQFCIVEPTFNVKKHRPHELKLLGRTLVHYSGHAAGLVVAAPGARTRHQRMSITPVPVARGYVDKDSVYHRLTISSRKARTHRFLTLLVPLPDRTLKRLPDIGERQSGPAEVWTATKEKTQTTILLPKTKGTVRAGALRFAGDLLLAREESGRIVSLCALGAREIEIAGTRRFALRARSHVFAERTDGGWRVTRKTVRGQRR